MKNNINTKKNIQAVILAAGKSSRFNSPKTKLLHKICGKEIISYSVDLLSNLNIPTIVVVGHKKEEIINAINNNIDKDYCNITYCEQSEQLGTGHAVKCTLDLLYSNNVLIINADMPLVKSNIIEELISTHENNNSCISFITAYNDQTNNGYGRVIDNNNKIEIIEVKELKQQRKDLSKFKYINAGIYLIKRDFLLDYINKLQKSNITQEFYITDLIKMASDNNLTIKTINADINYLRGINTQQELFEAEQIKKQEIIDNFISDGVVFKDINTVDLDINVIIESGAIIESNVKIKNKSVIGPESQIESGSQIINSYISNNVKIKQNTIIENSKVKEFAEIGPFAHVHKNSLILEHVNIGNFVEISRSIIGKYTKAKHLSYIGFSKIGSKVNIGAGTITCNYNGITKNKTIIKDNAFIGSNSALIAPITIGKGAIIAAGSVITKDIPDNALAISRIRETIKENYAQILFEKYKKKEQEI